MGKNEKGKQRIVFVAVLAAVLWANGSFSRAAEIRTYLLGDIDDFVYNGTGSVDDVYIDPDWQNWAQQYHNDFPVRGFDILEPDRTILFTFRFDLAPYEYIIGATLTLGLRNTVSGNPANVFVTHDGLVRPDFFSLNWYPSDTGTTICALNLANVQGYNLVPDLQSGSFSGAVGGRVAVDYAELTLEVVPEPATVFLLGIGFILARKRFSNQ